MKRRIKSYFSIVYIILFAMVLITGCEEKDEFITPEPVESEDILSTAYKAKRKYFQQDQVGRPAINTVFVSSDRKDEFNLTPPSIMGPAFANDFTNVLNSFGYQSNVLGLDAATFAGVLATDVLNVDLNNATAFISLNGRTLADDVIDTELLLIFGGADGSANPQLTSDGVDANDKSFSNYFPYLASPHRK